MTHSPMPAPGAPLGHYVSDAPFDPYSVEAMTPEQERVFRASQLRLIWWKFRRHKLAQKRRKDRHDEAESHGVETDDQQGDDGRAAHLKLQRRSMRATLSMIRTWT